MPIFILERGDDVRSRGLQRRRKAEQQRGHQGEAVRLFGLTSILKPATSKLAAARRSFFHRAAITKPLGRQLGRIKIYKRDIL